MTTAAEAIEPNKSVSPLDAFNGGIAPARIGVLYRTGLAFVAFAMVLLPLIYVALIAFTIWAVLFHLKNDTAILQGTTGRGAIVLLALYLAPAVAGGILVFFMVKPFFAKKGKTPDPVTLDPAQEPLLFAFVQKICELVGAPIPRRIDVDCQANASASLRKGLWSRDLVLTIGLPLVSGLDMRQFAGVLAHEFGHFAQGAGMRLTYVIRKINFWFARVVYERDEWDVKLERSARTSDWRIAGMLHAARGCIWLTRRILWALMNAGHAISCFMLRQMEFDADSYEAKIAGSDAFEATALRLRVLNVATQMAYNDVQQSWTSNRLPENLPFLIDHKATSLPEEVHQKLSASVAAEKTGWFHTHPCDADRVRAARLLNEPGVFRLTEPAPRLFSDFGQVSKLVTRHEYAKHMELEFTDQNLMSAEEIIKESAASAEAAAMVRKYYAEVNISLKPLLEKGELPPVNDNAQALSMWRERRQRAETLRSEATELSEECVELHKRMLELTPVHHLAKAGFKLDPAEFGLPAEATSPAEQETATQQALEANSVTLSDRLAKLDPFIAALRGRVTVALQVALANASNSKPEIADEIRELASLLAAVAAEMPRTLEIGARLRAFTLLLQNRGNHSNPGVVDAISSELVGELAALTQGIQERLSPFRFPFPHARDKLTVAEYVRSEKPFENEWQRVYQESDANVDRLFALHYRLIGRILAHADAAENEMEI